MKHPYENIAACKKALHAAGFGPASWATLATGMDDSAYRLIVQQFQHAHGLVADGVVGPLTWAALHPAPVAVPTADTPDARAVALAEHEVGVHEQGGNNRGARVEEYQRSGGGKAGDAWCAFFLHWLFKQVYAPGKPPFRIGGSVPDILARAKAGGRLVDAHAAVPGNALILCEANGHGYHIELITAPLNVNGMFATIGGNTSDKSIAEGDAVARKLRPAAGNKCVRFT